MAGAYRCGGRGRSLLLPVIALWYFESCANCQSPCCSLELLRDGPSGLGACKLKPCPPVASSRSVGIQHLEEVFEHEVLEPGGIRKDKAAQWHRASVLLLGREASAPWLDSFLGALSGADSKCGSPFKAGNAAMPVMPHRFLSAWNNTMCLLFVRRTVLNPRVCCARSQGKLHSHVYVPAPPAAELRFQPRSH